MEGMRVSVLLQGGAAVSDLRVGIQRKKPTKSANKRVQVADAEGERAAVPRHYPSFSSFDAMLFSSSRALSLSFFFLLHSIVFCRNGRRHGGWRCIVKRLTRTERAWCRSQCSGGRTRMLPALIQIGLLSKSGLRFVRHRSAHEVRRKPEVALAAALQRDSGINSCCAELD